LPRSADNVSYSLGRFKKRFAAPNSIFFFVFFQKILNCPSQNADAKKKRKKRRPLSVAVPTLLPNLTSFKRRQVVFRRSAALYFSLPGEPRYAVRRTTPFVRTTDF
jgi:hypothetical protein